MNIYGDHLTRIETVNNIVSIVKSCAKSKQSTTFSIEGEWGRGKTWTIDKVSAVLKGIDITQNSKTRCRETSDYLVFNYNAWEKDYYSEPLLAILMTLINQLNDLLSLEHFVKGALRFLYEDTKIILEETLKSISKRIIGVDIIDIGKRGINLFKRIKDKAKIQASFNSTEQNVEGDIKKIITTLNKLATEKPIVFIVDELDRCMPEHAIKTLERLHHVFGKISPSVTIISINELQLKKSVEQMFGKSISFEAYLRKFIDFRINLDNGVVDNMQLEKKVQPFFELFNVSADNSLKNEILSTICSNMTAREFEKIYNNAVLCHQLTGEDTGNYPECCALAEIFAFACKIVMEKEGNSANISPLNANNPTTVLGEYIKNYLKKVNAKFGLDLDNENDMFLYVCWKILGFSNGTNLYYNVLAGLNLQIDKYYSEYRKYYALIK